MKLSVIIPVYNVENYVEECLDSVFLQQDLDKCEVICVNDGSTDDSRAILGEYKEKYPGLVIVDRENGGLSAARNSGMDVAKGDYIYFLDSDDYLYPGVLKKMVEFADGKNLDLCFFNVLKDGSESYFTLIAGIEKVLPGEKMYGMFYERNNFFPPSAVWMYLYKRSLLNANQIRFKEGIIHEDEEFTPRAYYYAERTSYSDFPVQYHRVLREGSLTAKTLLEFKEEHLRDIVETCEDLCLFFRKREPIDTLFYLKIFSLYLSVARQVAKKKPEAKNRLFKEKDLQIMKQCAVNWEWYAYYRLFRTNISLFTWYSNPNGSVIVKKLLNRFFRVMFRFV